MSIHTGYHYTTLANYHKISLEGLIPYKIDKSDLRWAFHDGFYGVWLWRDNLENTAEIGSVLWQVFTKGLLEIVKLAVEYNEDELLTFGGTTVEIYHDGRIGSFDYHYQEPAIIVTQPILPTNIKLLQTYNLPELFKL